MVRFSLGWSMKINCLSERFLSVLSTCMSFQPVVSGSERGRHQQFGELMMSGSGGRHQCLWAAVNVDRNSILLES